MWVGGCGCREWEYLLKRMLVTIPDISEEIVVQERRDNLDQRIENRTLNEGETSQVVADLLIVRKSMNVREDRQT